MTTLDMRAGGKSQWFAVADALRVHQWVKNLLVFVPVLLDHKISDPAMLWKAIVAFVAFCCAASGAISRYSSARRIFSTGNTSSAPFQRR